MEKKRQEQNCWLFSDRSYCNVRYRADNKKEYALSIRLEFYASTAIHPSLVPTDGGTTVHTASIKQEWETI